MPTHRISDEAYWTALEGAPNAKGVLSAATSGAGWESRRRSIDGATPWMVVLEKGFQSETMPQLCKRMFENGIDFTVEDAFGRTFWAWALHYGIEEPDGPSQIKVPVEIPYGSPVPQGVPTEDASLRQAYVLEEYTWLTMLRHKMPDMRNKAGEGVLVQMASHHPHQVNWAMAPAHCLQELTKKPVGFSFSQDEWLAGSKPRQHQAGLLLFETSLSRLLRPIPNSNNNTVRTRTSRGLTETLGAFVPEALLENVEPTLAAATRLACLLNNWPSNDPADSKYEPLRKGLMEHAPYSWWKTQALKNQFSGGFAKSRGWHQWVESMEARVRAYQLEDELPQPQVSSAKPRF